MKLKLMKPHLAADQVKITRPYISCKATPTSTTHQVTFNGEHLITKPNKRATRLLVINCIDPHVIGWEERKW